MKIPMATATVAMVTSSGNKSDQYLQKSSSSGMKQESAHNRFGVCGVYMSVGCCT